MPKKLNLKEIKEFLDGKVQLYNKPEFIVSDPVSIPHLFTRKEDIEIAGFFAATIAWGQRPTILKNARKLMHWMDDDPYAFIMNFQEDDLTPFKKFVHRTFNGEDAVFFLKALQNIYRNHGGLEGVFGGGSSGSGSRATATATASATDLRDSISHSRKIFLEVPHLKRSEKHFSNPEEGSAAKRINMFLRWMVRKDQSGVDFGIWKSISPALLTCPLDVHSGRVARKLGLLKRTQNDWRSASELTHSLRLMDVNDPVKYDFALFGLGVFERF